MRKVSLPQWCKALILPVAVFSIFFVLTRIVRDNSVFGTPKNMYTAFNQLIRPTIMAYGVSLGMQSGRWDFSAGAMLILSAVIGVNLTQMSGSDSPILMMCLCVAAAVVLGLINAGVYLFFHVSGLVVSLGMIMIYETLTAIVFGGNGAYVRGNITNLAKAPYSFIPFILMIALYWFVLNKTVLGYNIRGMGKGQTVARNVGVSVRKTTILTYIISGIFIGVAAALYVSTNGKAAPTLNMGTTAVMFESMMCVIVGEYLNRYCDMTVSILIGCITMRFLSMGLLCIGLSSTMQTVAQGVFLVVFIGISSNQGKIEEKRILKQRAANADAKAEANAN